MPRASACRMAAIESASSCFPQPKDQPEPPIAQAPNPVRVICIPVLPSGAVGSEVLVFGRIGRVFIASPSMLQEVRLIDVPDVARRAGGHCPPFGELLSSSSVCLSTSSLCLNSALTSFSTCDLLSDEGPLVPAAASAPLTSACVGW